MLEFGAKGCILGLWNIFLWGHNKWKLLCFKTGKVPTNELQIYTWKDASLKELTSLVREVNTESRRKGTFFDFALIYPSPSSRGNFQRQTNQFMDYISKEIGTTVSGRKGVDDSKVSSRKNNNIAPCSSKCCTTINTSVPC